MSKAKELRIPPGVALQVSKALRQLEFVAGKYGRTLLTPANRARYAHDFEVIHAFGNLRRVGVEFLSKGTVVAAMWVKFDPATAKVIDSARGVEPPFIPLGVIDDHRVLMSERNEDKVSTYRQYLDSPWSRADNRPTATGQRYESDHAAAISGGTCTAEFHVADFALHRGRISHVSPQMDWAKAWDAEEMQSVFLHKRYCVNGMTFTKGQVVTYVLVPAKRGLQGRNIRSLA